jgi:putative colanic acid biosynthesis UDP-glucose lipid carrier transferase
MILLAAYMVAYFTVFGLIPLPAHYRVAILVSVLLLIVVFNAYTLYRAWRGVDYTQEFTAIFVAWTTVFGILIFFSVITKTSADFSRAWLIQWYVYGLAALLSTRYVLRRGLQSMRARGYNMRHIVIIASGAVGRHVFNTLRESPEAGLNIMAYFSDDEIDGAVSGDTHHGSLPEAIEYIETNDIDQIWLAMPLRDADKIHDVIDSLGDVTIDIRLVPDIFGFRLLNHSVSTIAGMPVVNLSVTPMDGINRWIKAAEDKIISAIILVLVSPLLLLISLAIKLSGPGPVFYKQERLSWNGTAFTMYKFRTMPEGTEEATGAVWASNTDNRSTPIGRLLRRTSLDELPQFWNVLKGDMSIVGPRPERPEFVERFRNEIPQYMKKHMVKAGITGWAQVNGWRGNTDLKTRVEYDLYYIDNWSLWLDLRIMFLTIFKGLVHKNAY